MWSAGLGLAGALLGYAFALGPVGVLAIAGALYTGSLGLGPGGDRVRGPLRRVVHPLAERLGLWVAGMLILLGLASLVGAVAAGHGPDWTPSETGPFTSSPSASSRDCADRSLPGRSRRIARLARAIAQPVAR